MGCRVLLNDEEDRQLAEQMARGEFELDDFDFVSWEPDAQAVVVGFNIMHDTSADNGHYDDGTLKMYLEPEYGVVIEKELKTYCYESIEGSDGTIYEDLPAPPIDYIKTLRANILEKIGTTLSLTIKREQQRQDLVKDEVIDTMTKKIEELTSFLREHEGEGFSFESIAQVQTALSELNETIHGHPSLDKDGNELDDEISLDDWDGTDFDWDYTDD